MLKTGLGHLQCYRHPRLLQVFDRKNVYDTVKKRTKWHVHGSTYGKETLLQIRSKSPFVWMEGEAALFALFRLGLEAGRVGGSGEEQFITHRENRISRTSASLSPSHYHPSSVYLPVSSGGGAIG